MFPHYKQGESAAVSRTEVQEELEEEAGRADEKGAYVAEIVEDEGGEGAVIETYPSK